MSNTAKTVTLKHCLDEGVPGPDDFVIKESAVPAVQEGDVLFKALVFSADPYLRGGIKSGRDKKPGDAMVGFVAGKVLESKTSEWAAGDLFGASLPFSTVQVVTRKVRGMTMMWKLNGYITEDEISLGVGVMGMPGSTAYGGVTDILRPNEGETLFVSAAAGAVGGLVGQIAKNVFGCKVVGSCGGPVKNALVKEKYGFDHSIDYKTVAGKDELVKLLKEAAPDGIDMYFENVGGIHFDAAMDTLRPHGRIAVCGGISQYNTAKPELNQVNIMQMIYSFQRIEGFMCAPWLKGAKGNFLEDMSKWRREGKIHVEETFFDGIESWPLAFQSLFTGTNKGKVVVRVA